MAAAYSIVSTTLAPFDLVGNREVDQDLEDYLVAICSYPDHLAAEPHLSFERHLLNIMSSRGTSAVRSAHSL